MVTSALEEAIAYRYINGALLKQALTHRSYGVPHNERLEYLGDGVLNVVIAHELFTRFPDLPEGDLSRLRANLVRQDSLAGLAQSLNLGSYLRLGEGEIKSGGASRPSILADALEAIIGACFLDGGFDYAHDLVVRLYTPMLAAIDPAMPEKDPKTMLQEWLQGKGYALPTYGVTATRGQAHAQEFEVQCAQSDLGLIAKGKGASRRAAEQSAAANVLELVRAKQVNV